MRLVAAALLCFCGPLWAGSLPAEGRYEQRKLYTTAVTDLNAGRVAGFEAAKKALQDYPLYPYLEFSDLSRRLRQLDPVTVNDFRNRFADSPVAERLYTAWLGDLVQRGAWQMYLEHYQPPAGAAVPVEDVELRCYYLRALYRSGERNAALAQVADLWRVPRSQPQVCDPLFDTWIDAGLLKQGLVWERFVASLEAGEVRLAQYLAGMLTGHLRTDAATFMQVSRHPKQLVSRKLSGDAARNSTMIAHTLRRYARTDARAASALWDEVSGEYTLLPNDARRLRQDLTIERARAGIIDLDADLAPSPDSHHLDVAEALLAAGIQGAAWPAVELWIRSLDPVERVKPKWRYWLARALSTTAAPGASSEAEEIFASLARERQYYGFLAATSLGVAPVLNERPSKANEALVGELRARPAMSRVEELFAVGAPIDARREWQAIDATLDLEQRVAAAHLAAGMGWIPQSVMAANAADLINDVTLRFPAPFRELFLAGSNASTVPLNFLYAIGRQESVFAADARSPSGALGVMQLMPATAAMTARAVGLPKPLPDALLQADLNIAIGSHHLAELMVRYRNHRVLVAAAYNAGAGRVDRWVAARSVSPIDVWIESIPFVETRNYVKNVLAFAYIYGQLLERPAPFLLDNEQ